MYFSPFRRSVISDCPVRPDGLRPRDRQQQQRQQQQRPQQPHGEVQQPRGGDGERQQQRFHARQPGRHGSPQTATAAANVSHTNRVTSKHFASEKANIFASKVRSLFLVYFFLPSQGRRHPFFLFCVAEMSRCALHHKTVLRGKGRTSDEQRPNQRPIKGHRGANML